MQLRAHLRRDQSDARIVTPAFAFAVILLAVAALLAGPVAGRMKIKQRKLPLPLRAPLNTLDESALAPFAVISRQVLEPAIVEALGTPNYLYWRLEDSSVARDDPLRFVELFVTYDTGGRTLVPHVPDVCRLGAGYTPAQPHENLTVELESLGAAHATVPIRVCTFAKTSVFDHDSDTVIYTFRCNARFVATRTDVRLLVNNLSNTYSYFSKVEVSFPRASRDQSVAGVAKVFNRVLPALIREHWPDFEAAEADARNGDD